MPLTEMVEVWTSEPSVRKLGEIALVRSREDGLPLLLFNDDKGRSAWLIGYTPATFPAAWSLRAPRNTCPGPLLTAWQEIEHIREKIAIAEREEEGEDGKS